MQLEITCPNCGKQSRTTWDRVPGGKLKTTCHACKHQFALNKDSGLNCRVVRENVGPQYADNGWLVEHPACQGMQYDIDGVEGLIRSGMVGEATRVQPPGERAYLAIKDVPQFAKALAQWESKNARSNR